MTLTLNDLIPTSIANDIKYLCEETSKEEYQDYQIWLEIHREDDDGHKYQVSERIKEWINKEVPF